MSIASSHVPGLSTMTITRRLALLTLLAWLAMIAFDLFLHGGLLAHFYMESSPFLLPPLQAFRRIPLGYLGFLLSAILLLWLSHGRGITGGRTGLVFGLKVGGLIQAAATVGLLSITTADPFLLLGWFLGQTLQFGIAGAVLGAGLAGQRLARLARLVVALLVVSIVMTVTMQSLGLSPAIRIDPQGR